MKPPYHVPTMQEIRAIPWNGRVVVSTFAGGGGSSTGYRMAGFRVLYANEFIPAAQDTYRANKADYTHLDGRDIRQIKATDIEEAIGRSGRDIDIFDGSPPCAAFSTAGKREAGWGKVKAYSDTMQRVDDLFFEYARLLKDLQPRTFVAENVSGLVKGTAKGYFLEILAALKSCGYRVKAQVLDAQWLGVPQSRARLIFVGVRNDLGLEPVHPKPWGFQYTVREALAGVVNTAADTEAASCEKYATGRELQKMKPGETSEKYFQLRRAPWDGVSGCITQKAGDISAASECHPERIGKFTVPELKRICSFPDDYALSGDYQQQVERMGRAVPPLMMKVIAEAVYKGVLCRLS